MRLIVDANILVGELLRVRGQALVAHPQTELFMAARAWNETQYELQKRAALFSSRRGIVTEALQALLGAAVSVVEAHITVVDSGEYETHETEAKRRIELLPDNGPD